MPQCRGITKKGLQCRNGGPTDGYCYLHVGQDKWTGPSLPDDQQRRAHALQGRCSGMTLTRTLCNHRTTPGAYCWQHQTQRDGATWRFEPQGDRSYGGSEHAQQARQKEDLREQQEREQRELNERLASAREEQARKREREWNERLAREEQARKRDQREREEQARKREREWNERLAREEQARKRDQREREERETKAQRDWQESEERKAREAHAKAREREARESQRRQESTSNESTKTKSHKTTSLSESQRAEFSRRQRAGMSSRHTRASAKWRPLDAVNEFIKRSETFATSRSALTFASIPWPILKHPSDSTLDDITWDNVAVFLKKAEASLPPSEVKVLLKRSMIMFHPDRWASNGVAGRIKDHLERDCVLYAGMVVSQAIGSHFSRGSV